MTSVRTISLLLLICIASRSSYGAHLRVEAPYSMPFPLPPAEALAFFATPHNWAALSKLPFRLGTMITPSVSVTTASACGDDVSKPATCGWAFSYGGAVAENYTDYLYNPVDGTLNFTLLVGFGAPCGGSNGTTNSEHNSFWCTRLPDGNCELHRMVVADIEGEASTLEQYKASVYFQATKELIEWVGIAGGWVGPTA